jgi:hypothetical protein
MQTPKRRLSEHLVVAAAALVLASVPAIAAEPKPPQWYDVITGVLAIPAALIGLAYSYLLIKKTRLEARKTELDSRKTELEILEKEHELAQFGPEPRIVPSVSAAAVPAHENRLFLLLLLRFVVLSLILSAWGVIEDTFSILFAGIVIGVQQLFSVNPSGWSVIPFVILQKLPKIAYWLVFFSLAWPLFKDTNSALGINVKSFLKVSSLREMNREPEPDDG